MKLKEAIDQFTSWRRLNNKREPGILGYERALKLFCVHISNVDIEDIGLQQILDYLGSLQDMGWERSSIALKCAAFRQFFRFFRLQGYQVLSEELIPKPRTEVKMPRVATDQEYQQILRVIPQEQYKHIRNRALIMMLYDTGARIGELMALNVPDLDIANRRALIRTEKARRTKPFRYIFWSVETSKELKTYLKVREGIMERGTYDQDAREALFLTAITGYTRRLKSNDVRLALRGYCRKAGIRALTPHCFRHLFGRTVRKRGATERDTADLLGHVNIESAKIYTMLEPGEVQDVYTKFRS